MHTLTHSRFHRQTERLETSVRSAFIASGSLLLTILTILILFFGVFTQMGEEEFIDEITARVRTEDGIYRTMARDIYQAGTVLQTKKYRLLAYAYQAAGLYPPDDATIKFIARERGWLKEDV